MDDLGMVGIMSAAGNRTTPRREVELVAACQDHRGKDGLALAVTISIPGRGMVRKTFLHDVTVEGLAKAWEEAGQWLKAGGQ
jgi:hypothetical protein